jgi:hypothetical protein
MNKQASKQQSQYSPKAGNVSHHSTLTYHKPPTELTPDEALNWIRDLKSRLAQKMRRERDYLDRRAGRGTHTPTDDAYEADQVLEAEIMGLLETIEHDIAGK